MQLLRTVFDFWEAQDAEIDLELMYQNVMVNIVQIAESAWEIWYMVLPPTPPGSP